MTAGQRGFWEERDIDPEEHQRRGLPRSLNTTPPDRLTQYSHLIAVRQQLILAGGAKYRPRCEWALDGDDCEGRVQLHHYWPKAVFPAQMVEAMHKAFLCARHHTLWHDGMQLFYVQQFITLQDRVDGRR